MRQKRDYVKNAKQTRPHGCHWPGCNKNVPPALWGCSKHWFMLPQSLRAKLWLEYKPGQEAAGNVSEEYIAVAKEIQEWITKNHSPHI